MNHVISSEPQFQELDAPVYTLEECNYIVSVMANCMSDFHRYHSSIKDIEEYVSRFPFIRKETLDHILNVITTHMSMYE